MVPTESELLEKEESNSSNLESEAASEGEFELSEGVAKKIGA